MCPAPGTGTPGLGMGGTQKSCRGGSSRRRAARGPLAPKMPLEGGTSEGDTRARLSSQKAAEAFISSTSSECQGCTKPRAGAQPRGERRGRCPPSTSLLPAPAASAPSQAPRSCRIPGTAARGQPVHPAPVGWPAANGYMRVLEGLQVPPPAAHVAQSQAQRPQSSPSTEVGFWGQGGSPWQVPRCQLLVASPRGVQCRVWPQGQRRAGDPGQEGEDTGGSSQLCSGGAVSTCNRLVDKREQHRAGEPALDPSAGSQPGY